jgi:UDP-glucose 4-epimerase
LEPEAPVTAPRVLVTGARGYLGGRLAQWLSRQGRVRLRLASRAAAAAPPGLDQTETIALGDYAAAARLDEACRDADVVVHLAAPNEVEAERDPAGALLGTAVPTLRLLEAAARAGATRFIYLSTAHVYGAPLEGEIEERRLPRPVHPYAIAHRAAEDFVLAAGAKTALRGLVLRLSNAVGAPLDASVNRWTLLANDLCRQAVTTGRLVLRSSGLQQRDFVPMADACAAIAHFLSPAVAPAGDAIFNIGSGHGLRVIDLAERIASRHQALFGRTPEIVRPTPARGESAPPLHYRVDRLLATGFRPAARLDDELDDTLRLCAQAFAPRVEQRAPRTQVP